MLEWRWAAGGTREIARPQSFEFLLQEARAGSGEAIGALLQQYHDELIRCAERELYGNLRTRVTAADVVQETFLRAHISFPAFGGERPAELGGWLRQLLKWSVQHLLRHHRQAMRHVDRQVALDSSGVTPEALAADDSTASQRAMRRERDEALESAIGRLPASYRRIILLRHRDGRSFAEVAATLEMSENAARKLWNRAVDRLRVELKLVE